MLNKILHVKALMFKVIFLVLEYYCVFYVPFYKYIPLTQLFLIPNSINMVVDLPKPTHIIQSGF